MPTKPAFAHRKAPFFPDAGVRQIIRFMLMATDLKSHRQFTIRQLFIAIVVCAVYLACRSLAQKHADQRFLWIVAPLFTGVVLSFYVAVTKGRYIWVLLASIVAPCLALSAWAIEIRAASKLSLITYTPTDLVTLACLVAAFLLPAACLSFAVGLLIRFGFDDRVAVPVRALVVAFAVAAYAGLGYSGYQRYHDPAFRYRVLGDDRAFRAAVANEVENGDSIEFVIQVLGEGVHRKENAWIEIQMRSKGSDGFVKRYPSGIQIDDVFIAYSDSPNQHVFQFRDGKLINLDTQWFQECCDDVRD